MTAIPIEVDLGTTPVTQFNSKLAYLEKANQQLQQRCQDLQAATRVSKAMLQATLDQLGLLKSGSPSVESYRGYADQTMRVLIGQVEQLHKRLATEADLRRRESSRVLISEQIREEETAFYREVLKEYEAKILELMSSIQEKERHVQILEQAEADFKYPAEKVPLRVIVQPRLPTREIMKLINDYDVNLILVERYKEENEVLNGQLEQERFVVKKLKSQLQKVKLPPTGIEISRFGLSELSNQNSDRCQSVESRRFPTHSGSANKQVDANATTQTSEKPTSRTTSSPKGKIYSPKRNQTLFENMVMLYKREQLNVRLLSKRLSQIQERLANESSHNELLRRSNILLQEQVRNYSVLEKQTAKQQRSRHDSGELRSKLEQKACSDKSLLENFEKQRSKLQDRRKHIAELYSRFRQQLQLLEEHLAEAKVPRRKLTYSLSCYELAFSEEQPTECSDQQKLSFEKQASLVDSGDFSQVMEFDRLPDNHGKGQTFGEYFTNHQKVEDNSLLLAFDIK